MLAFQLLSLSWHKHEESCSVHFLSQGHSAGTIVLPTVYHFRITVGRKLQLHLSILGSNDKAKSNTPSSPTCVNNPIKYPMIVSACRQTYFFTSCFQSMT